MKKKLLAIALVLAVPLTSQAAPTHSLTSAGLPRSTSNIGYNGTGAGNSSTVTMTLEEWDYSAGGPFPQITHLHTETTTANGTGAFSGAYTLAEASKTAWLIWPSAEYRSTARVVNTTHLAKIKI